MDKLNLLQKAYSKIQEFKDWNIKVEAEKIKFQDLTTKNKELINHNSSLEKESASAVAKFNLIIDEEQKELAELDRKIDGEKAELAKSEKTNTPKIKDTEKSLAKKSAELAKILSDIKVAKDEFEKISSDVSSAEEEKELVRKDIESLSKMSLALSEEIKSLQDALRDAGTTIAFAREREKELGIYERRIQRYYDEAGLKLKI